MDDRSNKILITGANGLVGSHVLRLLLSSGYSQVIALTREGSDLTLIQDTLPQVEHRQSDLTDVVNLERQLTDVHTIIHTAAMVTFDPSKVKQMNKANVEGTANLVNIALTSGVQHLIHISSIAALGRSKESNHISEESKWSESPLNTKYAISKYLAEQEAWRGLHEGLDVTILNPGIILGKGDYTKTSSAMVSRLAKGPKAYPIGTNGWVAADDVAKACLLALSGKAIGNRVVLVAESISYKDVFDEFAQQFGNRPPTIAVRPWMGAILWRADKLRSIFSNSGPLLTKQSLQSMSSISIYDNTKSKTLLGLSYIPIKACIAEVVEDYKKSGSTQ